MMVLRVFFGWWLLCKQEQVHGVQSHKLWLPFHELSLLLVATRLTTLSLHILSFTAEVCWFWLPCRKSRAWISALVSPPSSVSPGLGAHLCPVSSPLLHSLDELVPLGVRCEDELGISESLHAELETRSLCSLRFHLNPYDGRRYCKQHFPWSLGILMLLWCSTLIVSLFGVRSKCLRCE